MAYLDFIIVVLSLAAVYFLRVPKSKDAPPVAPIGIMVKLAAPVFQGRFQEVLAGFQWIKKHYGGIVASPVSVFKPWIFISDHKYLKEAFRSSACFGRPGLGFKFLYFFGEKPRGIILQDNESQWSEIRNFAFKKLKEHGTGKYALDIISAEEASHLISNISKNYANKPIFVEDVLSIPIMNVIWRVISGQRFELEDHESLEVFKIMSDFLSVADFKTVSFVSLLWILGDISTCLVFWVPFLKPLQTLRSYLLNYVNSSKVAFKGEVNTFTDAFLQKIEETNNPNSMFFGHVGEENLAATVGELLSVGSISTRGTLQWILMFLAAHPEKQARLQKEVDLVLEGRTPTFDDKKLMPYTVAVIQETTRIVPLIPIGVPHLASEDMKIGSYQIKKGSAIFSNTAAIQHDPEIWGDPQVFRPERFLSQDGLTVISHEALVAFGVGKRACPGKYLATQNLFIFVTSIFHQFNVYPDPNVKNINFNPKMFTFSLEPVPQRLVFSHRHFDKSCVGAGVNFGHESRTLN